MLKDITLGQYFPGNSLVHRLDPRTKLVYLIVYIVALFTADNWISYSAVFAFLVVTVAISRIPLKSIVKSMKPLVLVLIFTGVLNVFFTRGETVLWEFWKLRITTEGLIRAFFMTSRILMLITGTFLLTYTTSPIALTDGLESLLGPLKKIHLPVHELSMMMCIALRFIPTLIEETDKIMAAQKARGADFENGNLINRVKALVPILLLGSRRIFCRLFSMTFRWKAAVSSVPLESPNSEVSPPPVIKHRSKCIRLTKSVAMLSTTLVLWRIFPPTTYKSTLVR